MKKLLLIAVLVPTSLLFAQTNSTAYNSKISVTAYEAKVESSAPVSVAVSNTVLFRFKKMFPAAVNYSWQESKSGFLVRFTGNEIEHFVYLGKKGKFQSLIRVYTEKDLPFDVRDQVKTLFPCKPITAVKEVTFNNKIAYLVTIDEGTGWKTVRIVDGEMDIWQEIQKAK